MEVSIRLCVSVFGGERISPRFGRFQKQGGSRRVFVLLSLKQNTFGRTHTNSFLGWPSQ